MRTKNNIKYNDFISMIINHLQEKMEKDIVYTRIDKYKLNRAKARFTYYSKKQTFDKFKDSFFTVIGCPNSEMDVTDVSLCINAIMKEETNPAYENMKVCQKAHNPHFRYVHTACLAILNFGVDK